MALGTLRMALRLLARAIVASLAALAALAAVGLDFGGRSEAAAAVRLALADVALARRRLQSLDRLDRGHEAFGQRHDLDLLTGQPLDVAQVDAFVMAAEGDSASFRPGARGAADAV